MQKIKFWNDVYQMADELGITLSLMHTKPFASIGNVIVNTTDYINFLTEDNYLLPLSEIDLSVIEKTTKYFDDLVFIEYMRIYQNTKPSDNPLQDYFDNFQNALSIVVDREQLELIFTPHNPVNEQGVYKMPDGNYIQCWLQFPNNYYTSRDFEGNCFDACDSFSQLVSLF